MTQRATLPFVSVSLLGICLFLLLVSVITDINQTLFAKDIKALDGKLNLSSIDIAEAPPIRLEGEWQFFWQQFVLSDSYDSEIDAPNDVLKTPAFWQDQQHLGETIKPRGFATYRLRVSIQKTDKLMSLSMPVMGTAYRLYVNQELLDQAGLIARDKNNSHPQYAPKLVNFFAPEGKIDIVLQISNYDLAWGGQWFPITLSTADKQFQSVLKRLMRSVFIAAVFFTIAVLSLFLFALRPSDSLPFLLALSCICLGFREIETSQLLYIADIMAFSFNTSIQLNFLTFYLALPLITSYFHFTYPDEFKRHTVAIIYAVSAVFCISTFVMVPDTYSEGMRYFQFFALCVLLYGLYSILLAAYRGRVGAKVMAMGAILLFALAINDILFSLTIIDTGNMAGLGLLSFVLCQNYLTYVRFVNDSKEMKTLAVQVNQDPLTQLLNRRGLMDAIDHNSNEQENGHEHEMFSVMIIDFDHFKELNDNLGHDTGDMVLTQGSAIMQEAVRKQDLVARWGGEEFVVFMPNTGIDGAEVVAEKLRIRLSEDLSHLLKHAVTCSVGVAQSSNGESFTDCLKRADIALYSAKENGRNRTVFAP